MKQLYCISCPTGCLLSIIDSGVDCHVKGNACDMGLSFAKTEMRKPTRTLTSTVRTSIPGVPVLPVRTDGEIPKVKIDEAMRELNKIVVDRELDCGDTVLENVAGCGVRVIATSDALRQSNSKFDIQNQQLQIGEPVGGIQRNQDNTANKSGSEERSHVKTI